MNGWPANDNVSSCVSSTRPDKPISFGLVGHLAQTKRQAACKLLLARSACSPTTAKAIGRVAKSVSQSVGQPASQLASEQENQPANWAPIHPFDQPAFVTLTLRLAMDGSN